METLSFSNDLQCIRKSYQNPGKLVFTFSDDRLMELGINEAIEAWFDGHQSVKDFEWVDPYGSQPTSVNSSDFDTFAQMVVGDATAVGCAIVKIPGSVHITCTFDQELKVGSSVYEPIRPGSKCPTGMNPKYPGLCSEKESSKTNSGTTYQPVNWFIKITTLAFHLILTKLFIF